MEAAGAILRVVSDEPRPTSEDGRVKIDLDPAEALKALLKVDPESEPAKSERTAATQLAEADKLPPKSTSRDPCVRP
jgi:hypothetical protein